MKKVNEFFESFPANNEVFQTSDGFLFKEDGDAKLHANSLEDKEVETHKRKASTPKKEKAETPPKEGAKA